MALTTLPNEILLAITSAFTDEADLNALAQTNRRFYEILDEELYRRNVKDSDSSALLWASLHGHEASVRKLLRLKANVNACTHMRETTLPAAISVENPSIVTRNLQQEITQGGARLIASPLLYAAAMDHTAIMRLLIDAGAVVHRRHGCHRIPIMAAADQGRVRALEMLLDAGADIEAHGANCNTPLSLAASKGHAHVVKALLARGAAVDAARRGRTPLVRAAQAGHYDTVRALIDAGANVSAREHGCSPLMYAAQDGHYDILRALLDAGADVAAQDNISYTALMYAAQAGQCDAVRALLDAGADVTTQDNGGHTALVCAIQGDHVDVAALLLERGSELEAVSGDNLTPLCWAASSIAPRCVALLLDRGADLAAPNPPPLWHAIASYRRYAGNDDEEAGVAIVRILLARGARADAVHGLQGCMRPLIVAGIMRDRLPEVVTLLEHGGADPNSASSNGTTALLAAIDQGDLSAVDALLQHGADPNQPRGRSDKTPLAEAVQESDVHIVRRLLEGGATPRPADLQLALRRKPLSWDSTNGTPFETARLLIDHGADPTRDLPDGGHRLLLAVASKGRADFLSTLLTRWPALGVNYSVRNDKTPLCYAVQKGHLDAARVLLAHGADPNHVHGGQSLLAWAKERDDDDGRAMVRLLVEHGGRCDGDDGADAEGGSSRVERMIEAEETILSGIAEMGL